MKKSWKRLFTAGCIVALLVTNPGVTALADEMQDRSIVSVADEVNEVIDASGEIEETVGAVKYTVGDGVTATYDEETEAVEFYSNGGELWKDWTKKAGIDRTGIKSIKVASGTVYLPADSRGEYYVYENDDDERGVKHTYMFGGCYSLISLDLSGFDTSHVTDMSSMFSDCWSLTSLDLSGFDTSHVTDMSDMFFGCYGLTDLDLSNFDTSNVTDMRGMFSGCEYLTDFNLSGFDTSNVTDMSCMFDNCANVTILDLSSFDTSKVIDMRYMFDSCRKLKDLNVSSFDTSSVEDMHNMFSSCFCLEEIELSSFDTSNVTDMSYMFQSCDGLINLNLSNFDTTNVRTMEEMFYDCINLKSLNLSGFDISNVWRGYNMFRYCKELQIIETPKVSDLSSYLNYNYTSMYTLPIKMYDEYGNEHSELPALSESITLTRENHNLGDDISTKEIEISNGLTLTYEAGTVKFYSKGVTLISNWVEKCGLDRDSIKSIQVASGIVYLPADCSGVDYNDDYRMFGGLTNLVSFDSEGFDTSNVTNMSCMFDDCYSLKELNLEHFVTSNVKDMGMMFSGCSMLESLNISSFDTSNVDVMVHMFSNCRSLKTLDLSNFDTSNISDMYAMFYNCESLEELDLTNFNTSKAGNMYYMFGGCKSLKSLDLSSFDTSNVTNMEYMFSHCTSLQNLNISNLNTSNVLNFGSMFDGCSSLTDLDLRCLSQSKGGNYVNFFHNCTSLEHVKLKGGTLYRMDGMFYNCKSLKEIDLSGFTVTKDSMVEDCFTGCSNLQVLKTPKINPLSIKLPTTMYDETGKSYTKMPDLSNSITLTRIKPATVSGLGLNSFSDVQDPKHAYYKAIYWAADAGITKGYPDGTFGIDRSCTRGEMIMFLWRYSAKPSPKAVAKSPFSDVPKTHAFYNAILWASQKGITKGYPNGTFGINRNVSRGECMMFLWRLKGKLTPKAVSASPFKDVPKSHAFYKAILWGYQKGITTGYTSGAKKGTFGINENCTRGAIVTFLYRAK